MNVPPGLGLPGGAHYTVVLVPANAAGSAGAFPAGSFVLPPGTTLAAPSAPPAAPAGRGGAGGRGRGGGAQAPTYGGAPGAPVVVLPPGAYDPTAGGAGADAMYAHANGLLQYAHAGEGAADGAAAMYYAAAQHHHLVDASHGFLPAGAQLVLSGGAPAAAPRACPRCCTPAAHAHTHTHTHADASRARRDAALPRRTVKRKSTWVRGAF
jgi:hypothetical protein